MKTVNEKAPISVIITTYNDYYYLDQAIISVLKQGLLPEEIIVVDDGAVDSDSEKIVTKYLGNKEKVSLSFYSKENGGASSARNFGMKRATQDYVAFLDVDDSMLPNNLEEKYKILSNLSNEYFGVYGGAKTSKGKTQIFSSKIDGIVNSSLIDKENIGIPGGAPFYLLRKNLLISLGGFDETIKCNEDYDLIIRLFINGYKCKSSNSIGYFRNIREDSLSRPLNPMLNFKRVMYFLDKAEKMNFYEKEYLNYRRLEVHMTLVKSLILSAQVKESIIYARKGFNYSKPINLKQKIIYLFSLSFFRF